MKPELYSTNWEAFQTITDSYHLTERLLNGMNPEQVEQLTQGEPDAALLGKNLERMMFASMDILNRMGYRRDQIQGELPANVIPIERGRSR